MRKRDQIATRFLRRSYDNLEPEQKIMELHDKLNALPDPPWQERLRLQRQQPATLATLAGASSPSTVAP